MFQTYSRSMSMERVVGTNQEWDGQHDRRNPSSWDRYEVKVLSDIKSIQDEVGEIKKDISRVQVGFAEMKIELKQIVGDSATKTSGIVSTVVSIIGGVIVYVLTGMKG